MKDIWFGINAIKIVAWLYLRLNAYIVGNTNKPMALFLLLQLENRLTNVTFNTRKDIFIIFIYIKMHMYVCMYRYTHKHLILLLVFSHSVVSDSLQPHGQQHTRLPCPSSFPIVCSNSCPLSRWCHPTNSFSVIPFSSCLQSFPGSGAFPMSQLFSSGGQSIEASASASVLPVNIQNWFPLGLTGFISLQSKGLSRVFSNTTVQKHGFFSAQLSV